MLVIRLLLLLAVSVRFVGAQSFDAALEAMAKNDTKAAEAGLEALARANPSGHEVTLVRGVYLFQLGKFLTAR